MSSSQMNLRKRLPVWTGAFAVSVGVLVIAGWHFEILLLTRVFLGFRDMAPITAFCFMLAGASLALLGNPESKKEWRIIGQFLAAAVFTVGLVVASEYLFPSGIWIETFVVPESRLTGLAWRMAPLTGVNFMLFGLALLFWRSPRVGLRRIAEAFALLMVYISLLTVTGYSFSADTFYSQYNLKAMAFHSAFTFIVISGGLLFSIPDGLLQLLWSKGEGGRLARQLLPFAFISPIALGALELWIEQSWVETTAFANAISSVLLAALLSALIWRHARNLEDSGNQRAFAEKKLHENEERLRLAIEGAEIGTWHWDAVKDEITWSERSREIFAFPVDQKASYANVRPFLHPEDEPEIALALQNALAGRSKYDIEYRCVWPDKSLHWIRAIGTVFPDEEFHKAHMEGVLMDITPRKLNEELLREMNAELERRVAERTGQLQATTKELEGFCYSVSHDLRAPLRAIDGFSQILSQKAAANLDAQGIHYLERIRNGTQRMADLIDDLLALSRLSRRPLKLESVDLSDMAKGIVADLRRCESSREIRIEVMNQLEVEGDRALLKVILENLLGNAWKYTSKTTQPRIEFGAEGSNGEKAFFVRDNGAGFDMQYAGKLFTPFQRLHTEEEFAGTGIGLASVERIVSKHGGRVWAEGAVNEGATFHFSLGTVRAG